MKKIYVITRQWHGTDVWSAFDNFDEAQKFLDKENDRAIQDSSGEKFYFHETYLQSNQIEQ